MTEQVDYNEPIRPWDSTGQLERLAENYAAGQAAIEELAQLKPILAFAINKLEKKQLRLSLYEQSKLGGLDLQMKAESSGAIVFRSVKA